MKLVGKLLGFGKSLEVGMITIRVAAIAAVLAFAALATRYAINTYGTKFPQCDVFHDGCVVESVLPCDKCPSSLGFFCGEMMPGTSNCWSSSKTYTIGYKTCGQVKTATIPCSNVKTVVCNIILMCTIDPVTIECDVMIASMPTTSACWGLKPSL